jgi:uncharacterized damage-inducible protein DinB
MNHSALIENYRFLAGYNRWFNGRLYAACEQLPDEERKRDRGAFFGSIHKTLHHLVWGDKIWLNRFADQGVVFGSLTASLLVLPEGAMHGTVLYADWDELRAQREQLDHAIEDWTQEMPADFPSRAMRYSNSQGVQREHPAWKALTHFFNHQTHHRGQVTTLLAQAGIDPGVTDLIALA